MINQSLPLCQLQITQAEQSGTLHQRMSQKQRSLGSLDIQSSRCKWFSDVAADEETLEPLIRKGIHRTLGARPMMRTAQKYIGDAIRMALRSGEGVSGVVGVGTEGDLLSVDSLPVK